MELHKYFSKKNNSCYHKGTGLAGQELKTRGKVWQAVTAAGPGGWQCPGLRVAPEVSALLTTHWPHLCLRLQALQAKDLPLLSFTRFNQIIFI